MEEISEPKRARTPGKRYPGASIVEVLELVGHVDSAGGSISTGLLSTRLDKHETGSPFLRLLASARSYGLADYDEANNRIFRLTSEGEAALHGDEAGRGVALRRALVQPEVFAAVARALSGRQLPQQDALVDRFTTAGVAPSGAGLAAANFVASAEVAGALTTEGGRQILAADLPFDTDVASPGSAPRARASTTQPASGPRVPRGAPAGNLTIPPKPKPDHGIRVDTGGVSLTIHLDVSSWEVEKVVELIDRLQARTR